MDFTEEQLERYSRHIILQEVGIDGQEKILNSKILIIGAGGLGSPVALYLAAAGVGTIGIADADRVDLSNLQRQIIHFTEDVNVAKVESAANKMKKLNPGINVITYNKFLDSANIEEIISGYDFVIDGTDSFGSKFLINDACIRQGIPFSHGGILKFQGQTMTVIPGQSACYRCVFRNPPPAGSVPTCSQAGVLGAIAGMLGTIQAAEALKFVTGTGQLLADHLLTFDAKNMDFRKVKLRRDQACPVCSRKAADIVLSDEPVIACDIKK